MAIIAPLVGSVLGLSNFATGMLGLGLSLALNYFFPTKVEGPKAESTKAQTSKYGDPIGRVYGSARIAGAIIWLKNNHVDEHKKTERQGKAMGPVVTTYSYTATFAVAFVWNGPVDSIIRLWADNKLIYDNSADTLTAAIAGSGKATGVANGASITFYYGTDTQEPDPTIEAAIGSGDVPAWPGVAYVVIKNLPLDEFGIRVPNIEAEVVKNSTASYQSVYAYGDSASIHSTHDIKGDYMVRTIRTPTEKLFIYKLPTGNLVAEVDLDQFDQYAFPKKAHITDRNDIVVYEEQEPNVYFYDLYSGTLKQTLDGIPSGGVYGYGAVDDVTVDEVTYLFVQKGKYISCIRNMGMGWENVWRDDIGDYYDRTTYYTMSAGPDYLYMIDAYNSGVLVIEWEKYDFGYNGTKGFRSITYKPISGYSGLVNAAHYDSDTDTVIAIIDNKILSYDNSVSTVMHSTDSTWSISSVDPLKSKRMRLESGVLAFALDNSIYQYNSSDLSLKEQDAISNWDTGSFQDWASGTSEKWGAIWHTGRNKTYFTPKYAADNGFIADWLQSECYFAGIDCDVSEVTKTGWGYAVRDSSSPRGVIEDICKINFIDFCQVDGVLKFYDRNTTSIRTIDYDDVGVEFDTDPSPVPIQEKWPADIDIPERISIKYLSYDAYYRMGTQTSTTKEQEVMLNEPVVTDATGEQIKGRNARSLQISTSQVMTDDQAAQTADIMTNELRDIATTIKTKLPIKHIDLAPGDVVTLPLDNSRSIDTVITKMSGDIVMECEFQKRGNAYSSDMTGQPTPYVEDSLLGRATLTVTLIDGNLLRTVDDNDGFYVAVSPVDEYAFTGSTVYRSTDDGDTYNPWAAFTVAAVRGYAQTALLAVPHPEAFDRASSFTFYVPQGTPPDSVSEATLLSDTTINVFSVYNSTVGDWEYIRAANVTDNGDNTWTIDTLLRGRNGTEFAVDGHAIGDIVVHIESDSMLRTESGDLSLSRIYVPVSSGSVFDSINAVTFTNTGKGLRPWSPTMPRGTRSGNNFTGTFLRRDRVAQQWPEDGAEDPDMSEASEAYEVYVYGDAAYTDLRRTISVASESWSYTEAQQIEDFGSPQPEIRFGISQVSATYGAGIETQVTL